MAYQHIKIPSGGEKIKVNKDFSLSVPDNPIIPYIEGDGTGVDITPVMLKVVDGGMRSINVALRQELDLYVCLRPVRWFTGVPSPLKKPEDVDMVIFRENAEDIY